MRDHDVQDEQAGKASFDDIYDREDPREYFNVLGALDYQVPEHGRRLFGALIEKMRDGNERRVSVVDVCCSYGVNAALLKHDTTLEDVYAHYRSEEVSGLSGERLVETDTTFYARRRKGEPPRVIGLDVAENAVSYALRTGILDEGFAENLEDDDPSEDLEKALARTDLVTVTGGVSYVSDRTFDRLLGCVDGDASPWVAALVLRWLSYGEISAALSKYGLVTEKLSTHTFEQRRFTDPDEQEYVLEELAKLGIDPKGKESEGSHHTDFYLSRPAREAAETPLDELLKPALTETR